MQQEIIDFINGFSDSVIQGLNKTGKNRIEEHIEKYKIKLFFIAMSIAIISTGIFMTIWGISSYIDQIFAMRGLGFILVGIIAILAGVVVYNRNRN